MTTRATDAVFAEPLRIAFLVKGRDDPARPDIEITAPLVVGAGKIDSAAGRVQSWGSRIASGKAQVHITRADYQGPVIRKGDKVRALDRRGMPWWEVNQVDDRDAVRIILHLTEA